jgi:pseudouridine synthase
VIDLLPAQLQYGSGIHPVGRLDIDSTGALLLTNDGELTCLLTHPRHQVSKTYIVLVQGHPSPTTLQAWRTGINLAGSWTLPAQVTILDQDPHNTRLQIILREGRNRQVRRVAEQLEHPVLRLERTAIGCIPLHLPEKSLERGQHRQLIPAEVQWLSKTLNHAITLNWELRNYNDSVLRALVVIAVNLKDIPIFFIFVSIFWLTHPTQIMPDNLATIEIEQPITLQQIGSNLRQLRQNNSLSIEEIADRTRIQPRLIRAIENGEMEILPEPIYINGMVKKYGESLGVNGLELVKTLPSKTADISLAQDSRWAGFSRPQLRPIHLYAGYIILLLTSVSALSNVINTSVRNLQAIPPTQRPAITTSDSTSLPAQFSFPSAPKPQIWARVFVFFVKNFYNL